MPVFVVIYPWFVVVVNRRLSEEMLWGNIWKFLDALETDQFQ